MSSSDDDLWIDPIEVQRMEDADALSVFNDLAARMYVNIEDVMIPIYNEKVSAFINVCILHGVTIKQIMHFTGHSRYKIEKLLKNNKKLE